MLTQAHSMGYCIGALAKSSAGVDIPNRSTNRCSVDAPFLMPIVYGRLYRGSSGRRFLVGYVNSVQSAALLFDINGGSSPNEPEDTTMSNIYDLSARLPELEEDIYELSFRLTENQMQALEILLLTLLEADLSQFTHGHELTAMRARKAIEVAINTITEFGDVQ